jgi:tRNA G18 (ribose-2'-O)-methylase SpoU
MAPLERPLGADAPEIRETLAPLRNDFSVALIAPRNPFAVGGVIRVAHNFLAREVFLVDGCSEYAKATMGMHRYERIIRHATVEAFLEEVRDRPIWAFEKDRARISVQAVEKFPPRVVLAFGSERFGLDQVVLDAADEVVGIPIYGVNHSLPLVVAAGIAVHEWARRRYCDGAVV